MSGEVDTPTAQRTRASVMLELVRVSIVADDIGVRPRCP
jgi:hypothetical protein